MGRKGFVRISVWNLLLSRAGLIIKAVIDAA